MSEIVPITVAYGDGIGPEIMDAVMYVLRKAEAKIRIEIVEVGSKLYKKNYASGIADDTWESLKRTRVLLKAPITTPQGGGYKSLNVTLRKALGLYANVRPSISYHPFVKTLHPKLNVVIIRENEEDLYSGIEYRHTRNVCESMKLISRVGCEKIVRYAFDYAVKNNRKKVTCFGKDNIMKFSDGLFHEVFKEVAKEYPKIENEYYIVDIGTARLANNPEIFDVIVTSNLFGDIISDVSAEISGSVGMAGSANIGMDYAMFEAIHGSAPIIAGKNIANPSGLLNAAIMMLIHIGQADIAAMVENAWKKTIEEGVHTEDIFDEKTSAQKVGTKEFAEEIVKRFGQKPSKLKLASYEKATNDEKNTNTIEKQYKIDTSVEKKLVGVDVFLDVETDSAHKIAKILEEIKINLKLESIASMGLKLWPGNKDYKIISDHYCCRFKAYDGKNISHKEIAELLNSLSRSNIDFLKVENLYEFDGKRGYSLLN